MSNNKRLISIGIVIGIAVAAILTASTIIIYQLQTSVNTTIQSSPPIGIIQSVKPYTNCLLWVMCQTGQTVTVAFDNGTMRAQSSICAQGFVAGQRVSLIEWQLGFICSNAAAHANL